jgi:hypothetical protein
MRADKLTEDLKEKIVAWLISFHRLDPRHKILTFFNKVSTSGADNFCDDTEDTDDPFADKRSLTHIEQLLADAFNTTSILTVWRPCSNDAMRKMMEGSGVGKGLDIKGKSAQRGDLSAFVPFLQIHQESDKEKVQKITRKAKMRIYFTSEEAREEVLDHLEPLGNDYMEFDPAKVIHGEMIELDNYKQKGFYGIELSQRLFWHGLIKDAKIERGPDTATGRPSTPGFQDANNKTLKAATDQKPKPTPMPVLLQYNKEDPFSPQHLLMAYEENGTVTPVVSDFDGFLLGWRREALWFGCQLPRDQEDLMLWSVDEIEKILDGPKTSDTWTVRWLEVLKNNTAIHPDMPEYGFGDPKSYGIMERAAIQLLDTGAVRHGSECFNYYFPQEIDDTFLLISDTLKPVPWRYVNVHQLQSILSQRISDGFVFPLNPKWILCDPGWKQLYDQLMASDALYAEYTKDVWYPRFSGIREKIDRICANHPRGFQRQRGRSSIVLENGYSPLRRNLDKGNELSGNAAFDLAELELAAYTHKKTKLAETLANLGKMPEGDDLSSSDEEEDPNDMEVSARLTTANSTGSNTSSTTMNESMRASAKKVMGMTRTILGSTKR